MWSAIKKSIIIVFCFAIASGIIGYFHGKLVLTKTGVDWWLPDNLINRDTFITVGSIHNFSYVSGFVGLVAGVYSLIKLHKQHTRQLKH